MTAEQRTMIRQAVDQHKRTTLDAYRRAQPRGYCNGCQGHQDSYTTGCKACDNRRNRRAARARQAATQTEHNRRLERMRNRQCTRCARPTDDPTPVAKTVCVNCWDRQRQRRYKQATI